MCDDSGEYTQSQDNQSPSTTPKAMPEVVYPDIGPLLDGRHVTIVCGGDTGYSGLGGAEDHTETAIDRTNWFVDAVDYEAQCLSTAAIASSFSQSSLTKFSAKHGENPHKMRRKFGSEFSEEVVPRAEETFQFNAGA